jgi:branched-chain amino acid transport system substrate-binding protein
MRLINGPIIFYRKALQLFLMVALVIITPGLLLENSLAQSRSYPIRIGLAAPLTGPWASFGEEMRSAAQDAVTVINASGGLLGQPVELLVADDQCKPAQAMQIAEHFRAVGIDAVIGHCPPQAEYAARVYRSSNTLFISTFTRRTESFGFFNNVLHLGVTETKLGEAAADAVAERLEVDTFNNTVGIFSDGSYFSERVASSFESRLQTIGVEPRFNRVLEGPDSLSIFLRRYEPRVVFFAFPNPVRLKEAIGWHPPELPQMVTLGMPLNEERDWKDFYNWARETNAASNLFVFAPAALGEKFHRGELRPTPWQNEMLRQWQKRIEAPTLAQIYVFTAFDLFAQVVKEMQTTNTQVLRNALSNIQRKPTLLGNLRSGEDGEIEPLPYKLYGVEGEDYPWTPSNAIVIDYALSQKPARTKGGPVYNIEIEPKEKPPLFPLILKKDIPTDITFYIGPKSDETIAPGLAPDSILDAIANNRPIELTVTLFCYLSETDTYQQQKIRYDPREMRSDQAKFRILPSFNTVSNSHGVGKLIFVVDAKGMEIDIIQLNAIVGKPTEEALNAYDPPQKMVLSALNTEDISMPDLVIAIAPSGDGKLPVIIRPILAELETHIKAKVSGLSGHFWDFESGVSRNDLAGIVNFIYMDLRSMAEQNNQSLQKIYRLMGEDTTLSPEAAMLRFSEEATQKLLHNLATKGALLYKRIFMDGENRLLKVMRAINDFEERDPLNVRILAADVFAPWQISYTAGLIPPTRPAAFWGFRYQLGTLQVVNAAQGRMKTVLKRPRSNEVLFGAWRGSALRGVEDNVKARAEILKNHLKNKVGADIIFSDSKQNFLSKIKSDADKLKLIVAYGHGSSGTKIIIGRTDSGKEEIFTVDDIIGPCFIFADDKNEILRPNDLELISIPAHYYAYNPCHFKMQPIIILNACETGASGQRTADNNGFVGAWTRLGSRAVIVTEAPVWANFAQHFGQDLINRLFLGDEVRMALLKARKKHLERWGNPLGLVYSLYGNPAAKIEK